MKTSDNKPRLGVSACLLGKAVRFDGGHKSNAFILKQCRDHFELHGVCPEAELGLGIPRPAIQLRKYDNGIRLVNSKNPGVDNPGVELTRSMQNFSAQRIESLQTLDGFIFKKDSPSCGLQRVPVFNHSTGQRERNGIGVFAAAFKQRYPDVPTEDEGRLNDIKIRENFLERVYAHFRWRQIENPEVNLQAFREFHRRYKLVLMAKNVSAYRELGRLVASVNKHNLTGLHRRYFSRFMQVMASIPSPGQHVNVLMHVQGYLKTRLDADDKAELLAWYEIYRQQQISRATPLALLQHHFRHHPDAYMSSQYYFSPFPTALMQPV